MSQSTRLVMDVRSEANGALLPTPLQAAPTLARALGLDRELWVKRDDLIGPGCGGNKVRKLQFLLADASRVGADILVTVGAAQSNHARLTAILGRAAGFGVHLILAAEPEDDTVAEASTARYEGNVLLDRLSGAMIESRTVASPFELNEVLSAAGEQLASHGHAPYLIPVGGSNEIGTRGYVAAYSELLEQLHSRGVEADWIVHASGSGGTQAGLLAGRALADGGPRVFGIDIAKRSDLADCVEDLAGRTLSSLASEASVCRADVAIADFAGPGYGIVTPESAYALMLGLQTEGLVFDPIYSGKALAALGPLCRSGALDGSGAIVFIHTGGHPALFAPLVSERVLAAIPAGVLP